MVKICRVHLDRSSLEECSDGDPSWNDPILLIDYKEQEPFRERKKWQEHGGFHHSQTYRLNPRPSQQNKKPYNENNGHRKKN